MTRCANRPHGRRCPHAGTERPRHEPRIAFCQACVDSRVYDLRATVEGPGSELRYEALADLEADHGVALERLTRLHRRRAWLARWAELGLCPVRPCDGAASAYDVAEQARCRGVSRAWCSSAARIERENESALVAYAKANDAVDKVRGEIVKDWRRLQDRLAYLGRIVNTFEDYRKVDGVTDALARTFLAKAFTDEDIAEAEKWFGRKDMITGPVVVEGT